MEEVNRDSTRRNDKHPPHYRIRAVVFDLWRMYRTSSLGDVFRTHEGVLRALKKQQLMLFLILRGRMREMHSLESGERLFDSVFFVGEEEHSVAEAFRALFLENGFLPSEVVLVADRMRKEIRIGNSLGCITIWVKGNDEYDECPEHILEKPCLSISSLEELPRSVRSIRAYSSQGKAR